jgi:hypothetical protein
MEAVMHLYVDNKLGGCLRQSGGLALLIRVIAERPSVMGPRLTFCGWVAAILKKQASMSLIEVNRYQRCLTGLFTGRPARWRSSWQSETEHRDMHESERPAVRGHDDDLHRAWQCTPSGFQRLFLLSLYS